MLEKNERHAFSCHLAPLRVLLYREQLCCENNAEPSQEHRSGSAGIYFCTRQLVAAKFLLFFFPPQSLMHEKLNAPHYCNAQSRGRGRGVTQTSPCYARSVARIGLFRIRICESKQLKKKSTGHGLSLMEVTPTGTQKAARSTARRTNATEVVSGRACYRVQQSTRRSSLARPPPARTWLLPEPLACRVCCAPCFALRSRYAR